MRVKALKVRRYARPAAGAASGFDAVTAQVRAAAGVAPLRGHHCADSGKVGAASSRGQAAATFSALNGVVQRAQALHGVH